MPPTDVWSRIELHQGDITRLAVDAIVNAANSALAPGGGVCGAIFRAAGLEELAAACRPLGGCATGDAKITPGFRLPARFVIHTVGPVYQGGNAGEPEQLAACYRRSLAVAVENGLHAVAFPAISTGIFGYPFDAATEIALRTIADFLRTHGDIECVTLVFFSSSDHAAAGDILRRVRGAA
jgi:O-acetyl-ADP-ribose deacetylase